MERYRSFINLINFGLVILLIISVLFTTHISLPDNLMFIGRMHALVLHLPIGMFLVCLLFALFRKHIDTSSTRDFQQFIIELTATSALLSAQIGMLLAQENGYTSEHLYDHKVAALLFAFGMYIFSEYNKYLNPNRQWIALGVLSITLMFAGHNGGIITHGEDFLFPKNKSNVAQLDPATSSVYEWAIHPILTDKCMGCHNKNKTKGDLILTVPNKFGLQRIIASLINIINSSPNDHFEKGFLYSHLLNLFPRKFFSTTHVVEYSLEQFFYEILLPKFKFLSKSI